MTYLLYLSISAGLVLVTMVTMTAIVTGYCVWLYKSAKPKHRKEHVNIVWYNGDVYGHTGIAVPRALLPLFFKLQFFGVGLTCEASRILIYTRNKQKILFGKFEPSRQINGQIYDIGAGGMVSSCSTPEKTAEDELVEEIGFFHTINKNVPYTVVTPANTHTIPGIEGQKHYHCVIYVFKIYIDENIKFGKTDGTYLQLEWHSLDWWKDHVQELRDDARIMCAKLIH
jgi:8-oxo-dGTP pyrophosphatase MutT (NUDIX family)